MIKSIENIICEKNLFLISKGIFSFKKKPLKLYIDLYISSFRNHLFAKFDIKSENTNKNSIKANAVLNEPDSKETILYFEGD